MRMNALIVTVYILSQHLLCQAKILRNNALMTKMVSKFQREPSPPEDDTDKPKTQSSNIISLMHKVLCRNFPDIPCKLITQDRKLKRLIELSVSQISNKILTSTDTPTTYAPNHQLTLFPTVDSEDLSNFLDIHDAGFFQNKIDDVYLTKRRKMDNKIAKGKPKSVKNKSKRKKSYKRTLYSGSRKMTKFFPHKVKYKEKGSVRENSLEKMSMSMEAPLDNFIIKKHLSRKVEPPGPPVWRIDYMKHGDPSINQEINTEQLQGKLIRKPMVMEDNTIERRKDIMRPEVYIKKGSLTRTMEEQNNSSDDN